MTVERPPDEPGKRGRPQAGRRFSEAEFAAVAVLLPRVSSERLIQARLHLVDGISQSAVANQYECTRQNVNAVVNLVRKASEMLDEANKLAGKT